MYPIDFARSVTRSLLSAALVVAAFAGLGIEQARAQLKAKPTQSSKLADMPPPVRAEIERIADGTDAGKRATAITSLLQLGPIPDAAIPYLVGCLSDNRPVLSFGGPFEGNTDVGTLAARVLLRSGTKGIKALMASSEDSVNYALAAMTQDEATAVRSYLGSGLDKKIDELSAVGDRSNSALKAIGKLGGPHAVVVLASKLDGSRNRGDSAAIGLAIIVETTQDAKAFDFLVDYLGLVAQRICFEPEYIAAISHVRSACSVELVVAGLRPYDATDKGGCRDDNGTRQRKLLEAFKQLTGQAFERREEVERWWQANKATFHRRRSHSENQRGNGDVRLMYISHMPDFKWKRTNIKILSWLQTNV
jgi:hypothetical protein